MTGNPSRVAIGRRFLQGLQSGAIGASGLSLVVPAGQAWSVAALTVLWTSTGSAGNRLPTVELLDTDDTVLAVLVSSETLPASSTACFSFIDGGYPVTLQGATPLLGCIDGMPILVATAGQRFRVTDQTDVDNADSAVVVAHGEWEPA